MYIQLLTIPMKQIENIYEYRKLSKNRNDGVVAYNYTC